DLLGRHIRADVDRERLLEQSAEAAVRGVQAAAAHVGIDRALAIARLERPDRLGPVAVLARHLGRLPLFSSQTAATYLGLRGEERRGFAVVNGDRLVESGELEDLLVVLVQPACEKPLLLPIGADEECHEQPDPAT